MTRNEVDRWEIAERLISEEPSGTFDRLALFNEVEVFDWRFETAQDLAAWRWGQLDEPPELVAGGVLIRRGAKVPSMVRKIDLDAFAVDAIDLDVAGLHRGPLRWFWTAPGKNFVAELGSWIKGDSEAGGGAVRHRLAVSDQRGWTGLIHRLRIDPTMAPGEEVRIEGVRGVRYEAPEGFLDAAVQLSWKVDIDHEMRNALLSPPGQPVERRVEVPQRARMRFSYGLVGRSAMPVIYRVSARRQSESPAVLFEEVVDPAVDDVKVWRDAEIDLSAFGGQSIELVLGASVSGAWDASAGLPVWGNPEILRPAGAESRPNVVLISVDTLRPDHLSLYGYERPTSPRIDAWATRSAVVFETAVASAPWTLPSHVSLLSGLDADRHGVNHRLPMPMSILSLAEILRGKGYSTLAITGGGWMRPAFGFGQGFDRFHYWPPKTAKDDEIELGVGRAMDWLAAASKEPFFLFLHTFETHSPHRRRQPFFDQLASPGSLEDASGVVTEKSSAAAKQGYVVRKAFHWHRQDEGKVPVAREELPEVMARYDSGIAFTDFHLGRLLERVSELGLDRNTLVILTSDHGEAFGEKGLDSHGYLYDFNLLVPLIVKLPENREAGRRVVEQVRLVDVLPTVLEVLEVDPSTLPAIDGESLGPLIAGEVEESPREAWSYAASSNRGLALRRPRTKYLFNNTAWNLTAGRDELYDLKADPKEQENLSETALPPPQIRQRALERLAGRPPGIEIAVRCGDALFCMGRLLGAGIRGFQLKTLEPSGTPLNWDENLAGEATFRVPVGGRGRYLFESLVQEALSIEMRLESDHEAGELFRADVDSDLSAPWELRYDGSEWSVHREIDLSVTTAVTVSRRGGVHSDLLADPTTIDPELRDQLRALGYLDG